MIADTMNVRKLIVLIGVSLGTVYLAMPVAHGQEDVVVVETIHQTLYINGGIGDAEQTYMRKLRRTSACAWNSPKASATSSSPM